MRAIKLYAEPKDYSFFLELLSRLKLDTLLVGQGCLGAGAFLEDMAQRGLSRRIIEPVFLIDSEDPALGDLLALDAQGEPAEQDWVKFACPSNRQWRDSFLERVRRNAARGLEGQNLDFLRFFAFWETLSSGPGRGSIPETCFCPDCMDSLSRFTGRVLPHGPESPGREDRPTFARYIQAWVGELDPYLVGSWRQELIRNVLAQAVDVIHQVNPSAIIGVHEVPWTASFLGGAAREILGQDLPGLARSCDWFTPMTYHHMMGRPPSSIHDLVLDHVGQIAASRPVVPCIQVKPWYSTRVYSDQELEEAVRAALEPPSGGIAFFRYEDFEENHQLLEPVSRAMKHERKYP